MNKFYDNMTNDPLLRAEPQRPADLDLTWFAPRYDLSLHLLRDRLKAEKIDFDKLMQVRLRPSAR